MSVLIAIISTILLFIFLMKLLKGKIKATILLYIIYYILYIVPELRNMTEGIPDYSKFYGFKISYLDLKTNIIYNLFLSYMLLIFYFFEKKEKTIKITIKKSKNIIRILNLINIVILIIIFINVGFENLLKYGLIYVEKLFRYIHMLTFLGSINCLINYFYSKKNNLFNLLFLFIFVYLNGKRLIIVFALLGYLFIYYLHMLSNNLKNELSKKKQVKLITISLIILCMNFTFLKSYKVYMKNNFNTGKFDVNNKEKYLNSRIDLGRDDVMKLVIFSKIYPEKIYVLEKKWQTLKFNLLFYIPRKYWKSKPYPYGIYLTRAVVNYPKVKNLKWQMTSGILDEILANSNIKIFPIVVLVLFSIFLKLINKINKTEVKLLIIIAGILLMSFQLTVFQIIYIPIIILSLFYLKKKNKKEL